MSYCYAGGVAVAERALRALLSAGLCPALILTYNESLAHRSGFASLVELAEEHGAPYLATADINSAQVLAILDEIPCQLLVVGGWSQIVREPVLSKFPLGGVGIHPTLLPEGRGRAPIPWTIIKQLPESGVTLFRLVQTVDAGEIVGQVRFAISRRDDANAVYEKVCDAAASVLVENIPLLLASSAASRPQSRPASVWPRRTPADGEIHWTELTAEQVYDWVRALTDPYPGAFTALPDGRRLHIWRADRIEGCPARASNGNAGRVLGPVWSTRDGGLQVATSDGRSVVLRCVQVESEPRVDGLALLEGGSVRIGDCLG
jgi:methionyl-tRNA formyltransferase